MTVHASSQHSWVPCWHLLMFVCDHFMVWTLYIRVHVVVIHVSLSANSCQMRYVKQIPLCLSVHLCTYTHRWHTFKSVCFFVPHQANTLNLHTWHYIIHVAFWCTLFILGIHISAQVLGHLYNGSHYRQHSTHNLAQFGMVQNVQVTILKTNSFCWDSDILEWYDCSG